MDHQEFVCSSLNPLILFLTPGSSAWLFFKLLNVSGAEAVVAAASPWIGQGKLVSQIERDSR